MKRFSNLSLVSVPLLGVLLVMVLTQPESASGWLMKQPSVVLRASRTSITYPCPTGTGSSSRACPAQFESVVLLTPEAEGFQKQATYTFAVSGGQIVGKGSNVNWDFAGYGPGSYTATVEVRDSHKHLAVASATVTVMMCGDCMIICDLPCPTIRVTCYDEVKAGTPITCRVDMPDRSGACDATVGWSSQRAGYKWTARSSNGNDLSETISSNGKYVSIPTGGRAGQTVQATVEVPGLDPTCSSTASGSTRVGN